MVSRNFAIFGLFILALPFLSSCGDEGNSEDISISINPSKPFYSPANSSYVDHNGTTQTLTGPWTKIVFTISNSDSNLYLYVDSLKLTFTSAAGVKVTQTISLADAGCASGSARVAFANIAPLGSFSGDLNCDNTYATEVWYINGLPASTSGVLSGQIELSGFFHNNDPTTPTERAKKFAYFVTR